MRISLQNISDKLGLSRATVSRALRNDPRISALTKKRVKAVARTFGYRPNAMMSELAASRWQNANLANGIVIGYVDCVQSPDELGQALADSLTAAAQTFGYEVQHFSYEDLGCKAKLQRLLLNRGITDVLLRPSFEKAHTVELDWDRFVCVQVFPPRYRLPLHTVVLDHFNSVVRAWQEAVNHGYRRIGIVLWDHRTQITDDIMRLSATRACQLDLFPHLPALSPLLESESGKKQDDDFVAWVNLNKPEVIIGFSDGYYHLFRSKFGYEIPYISLHASPKGMISGICSLIMTCARESINLLHLCRRTSQWGIPELRIDHVIEPSWNEGSTLPRKPANGQPFRGGPETAKISSARRA